MESPIVKPFRIDFGAVAPGARVTQQCQLHSPSGADVTATILHDAGGVFRVGRVASYHLVEGIGPHPCADSDGQAPLTVSRGQLVAVDVEAMPRANDGNAVDGVLEIRGTGWTATQRPLRVVVEEAGTSGG